MTRRALSYLLAIGALVLAVACAPVATPPAPAAAPPPAPTPTPVPPTPTPTPVPPTPTPLPTPTPVPMPTPTPPPAPKTGREAFPNFNWDRLEGVSPVAVNEVEQRGLEFQPLVIQVQPGTTVTFTNKDPFGHTVTIPALGIDKFLSLNESFTVTFETEGTFDLVCTIHPPNMLMRVIVKAGPPPAAPPMGPTPTPTPEQDMGDYGGY